MVVLLFNIMIWILLLSWIFVGWSHILFIPLWKVSEPYLSYTFFVPTPYFLCTKVPFSGECTEQVRFRQIPGME